FHKFLTAISRSSYILLNPSAPIGESHQGGAQVAIGERELRQAGPNKVILPFPFGTIDSEPSPKLLQPARNPSPELHQGSFFFPLLSVIRYHPGINGDNNDA